MKKILFISSYPNPIDKYLYVFLRNLIYAIADLGVECHVISPVSVMKYGKKIEKIPRQKTEQTKNGNKIFVTYPRYVSASAKKIMGFNTGKITHYNYIRTVLKEFKKKDVIFDAVYGHFFVSGGLSAIKVGRKFGIPSFVAYGECDYDEQVIRKYRELKKKDVEELTGIISVSEKNTFELKNKKIFDDIPIFTCENAVDISLFNRVDKISARKKFNMPENDFIVGFVGGFIERKGDKRVLEACKNIDGLKLAFAGKGSNPPQGENVVFCDAVDHEEIGDFLSAIDVFVLPTLNEGCCNAVIEAMVSGKAIISSDLPFNDNVLNSENSIRINPKSIDEIRNSIEKLMDDKVLFDKISKQAKEDSKKYSIEMRAKKIYKFMEKYF